MFALPHAQHAFDPDGTLKDPHQRERLQKLLHGYLALAKKLSP